MGLDMYLIGELYLSVFNESEHSLCEDINTLIGLTSEYEDKRIGHNTIRVETIGVYLAYWRKANQIHKWFVDNVQEGKDDCQEYYVTPDELKQLKGLCKSAIEKKNGNLILPPQSGFFFGSTEIDEWYYKDLESTISQIDNILELIKREPFKSMDFKYHSSW